MNARDSTLHLNGKPLLTTILADSFEHSEVETVVPGRLKNINAHKVVLAAGSEGFRRERLR